LVYLFLGAFIAGGDLDTANRIQDIVSGVLAILLWPLVLLGIDLRF